MQVLQLPGQVLFDILDGLGLLIVDGREQGLHGGVAFFEIFVEQVDSFQFSGSKAYEAISEQSFLQIIEFLQQYLVILLNFLVLLLDLHQHQGQLVIELFLFLQIDDDILQLKDSLLLVIDENGMDYLLRDFVAGLAVVLQAENAIEVHLCGKQKQIESICKGLQLVMYRIVAIHCLVFLLSFLFHFPDRLLQYFHPKRRSTFPNPKPQGRAGQPRQNCKLSYSYAHFNYNAYIIYMSKEREKELKVYKGIFISNERKKRAGGRIRCQDFPNKIEVMGVNQALHESQVEWTEVRRYKKEKRFNREQGKKEEKGKKPNKEKEPGVKVEKSLKFKEKAQGEASQKSNIPKYDQKDTNSNKEEPMKQQVNKKKNQYKLKQEPITQEEPAPIKQQQLSEKIDNNNRDNNEENRHDKGEESDTASQEQEELQIIVGRIKRETNIKFQTRPFVGLLYFQKRRTAGKKKDVMKEDPIQQIMSDYFADLHPIHSRLPKMELDDLNPKNYEILNEYAEKVVGKCKDKNRKKYLNSILDELSSVYILMTFSQWDGEYPLANIHKIIGKAMTIDGECQRFLYEHGLNDMHYQQQKEEAIPIQPTPLHHPVSQMVFTIDPPTSTDLDDALSIEKISENVYSIGIHIADVTSYLHLVQREELTKRTTSVYLPYKVYHMLNRNLVKACSLDPGVDRLAFTIWVEMDLQGNLIGQSKIEKSIIKSRYKLSYGVVQDLISGNMTYQQFNEKYPSKEEEYDQLLEKLLTMTEIATAHRQQRLIFDVFQNRQMQFKLDEQRWPVQCFVEKRYTAKKVVQQFMIIGNIESAKIMIKACPENALVIHHPKPTKLSVSMFNEQFKQLETKFKFQNVLDVQKQLMKVQENKDIKDQIKKILYFKARRSMEPAIYRKYGEIIEEIKEKDKEKEKEKGKEQGEEFPVIHFALGLQFYTHFTSPMRRMADIVVHETLNQVISNQQITALPADEIEKINNGRRSTKRLKKDLNEIYLCLMIYHTKKPIQCEGIISSFGLESVSILIPLFDMQKEVMWKKEFKIYSIKRIRNKEGKLDVKLYHDPKTAKKDVYWVIERFQTVKLSLDCTKSPPLKLVIHMTVESEKGPFTLEWVEE